MDYNTQRKKLALPEYGRNIQKMVAWVQALPSKEDRNRQIRAVVAVMGNMNPHLRDVLDFRHKLWDHIQVISDFKIDINSPYPIPELKDMQDKPKRLKYRHKPVRFMHYGRCIESMIETILKQPEGDMKQYMIMSVANQMKKSYVAWNKDSVKDEQIIADLSFLSDGQIVLPQDTKLCSGKVATPTFAKAQQQQQQHRKNNNNNHNNNNNQRKKFKSNNNNNNNSRKK